MASRIDSKVLAASWIASTASQEIFRYTVRGNALGANRCLSITLDAMLSTPLTGVLPTQLLKLSYGTESYNIVTGAGTLALLNGLSKAVFRLEIELWACGKTNQQCASMRLIENMTVTDLARVRINRADFAQDSTKNKDVVITVQFGSALSTVLGATTLTRDIAIARIES